MVAYLSDPAKVYQAKNGKDAEALKNFKTQANQILEEIKAVPVAVAVQQVVNTSAGQTTANGTTVPNGQTTANGQIVSGGQTPVVEESLLGGISNSTLLIGVGVVGLIFFLKK